MKRILFVDDEVQVLDALRAQLQRQRSRWDMVFVEGGELALSELDRGPFHVIVSDMKMPNMDGTTLLGKVQKLHPGVVRIVLSGYGEMETALRTAPVAHQFLMKPCEAAVLENVVERACSLQALIQDDAVRGYASKLQKLPTLPLAYLEMTRVLADEHAGVEEVARVVERDPAMCVKVLKLVNSAFVGLGHEVTNIEQAISFLGTNMLKDLALVVQVFNPSDASPAVVETLEALQRHSLIVGTIARRMAGGDARLADDAFMAGVLHDIGKLILASEHTEAFEQLVTRTRAERRPMFELEQEVFGVTHAELGGYLLGIWGLPYPIVEATANHHSPGRVSQRRGLDTLATTCIANFLAHEQVARNDSAEAFAPLDQDYLQALGVEDYLPEWREIAASLGDDGSTRPGRRASRP